MKISALTVQHDKLQDRILLVARNTNTEQVLFLTRHLAFALLATLGKLIQQSQGDSRIAQAGMQTELLSMKHAQALSQVRAVQSSDQSPSMTSAPRRLPDCLLTQIDIHTDPGGRTLIFCDTEGQVARLTLDARQLHWLIGRLATHSRNAGWGDAIPMPDWLDQDAIAEFAANQAKTQSVH